MSTLVKEEVKELVQARGVRFMGDILVLELSDGREVSLPMTKIQWLDWLAKATPEQRVKWRIQPQGFAVYWEDLDDGFEVEHALSLQPLVQADRNP